MNLVYPFTLLQWSAHTYHRKFALRAACWSLTFLCFALRSSAAATKKRAEAEKKKTRRPTPCLRQTKIRSRYEEQLDTHITTGRRNEGQTKVLHFPSDICCSHVCRTKYGHLLKKNFSFDVAFRKCLKSLEQHWV